MLKVEIFSYFNAFPGCKKLRPGFVTDSGTWCLTHTKPSANYLVIPATAVQSKHFVCREDWVYLTKALPTAPIWRLYSEGCSALATGAGAGAATGSGGRLLAASWAPCTYMAVWLARRCFSSSCTVPPSAYRRGCNPAGVPNAGGCTPKGLGLVASKPIAGAGAATGAGARAACAARRSGLSMMELAVTWLLRCALRSAQPIGAAEGAGVAVAVGVLLALLILLEQTTDGSSEILFNKKGVLIHRSVGKKLSIPNEDFDTVAYSLSGFVSYVDAQLHSDRLRKIAEHKELKHIVLRMRNLDYCDDEALSMLEHAVQAIKKQGIDIHIASVHNDRLLEQLRSYTTFESLMDEGKLHKKTSDAVFSLSK